MLFDLAREHVDATKDDEVVATAGNLVHAPHRADATGTKPRQVAGAVTDDWKRLFGQRGEDKLARLAVGARRAGLRIDDLRKEVILPDIEPVLFLDSFVGDAGAHYL